MEYSRLLRAFNHLLLFCVLLIVVLPLVAAPGDLDSTWDGDGVLTFLPPLVLPPDQYGPPTYFNDVIVQPDGKLIGVGLRPDEMWTQYISATRFLDNAQIDATYGTEGIALADYATAEQWDFLFHAAQMPDGGILSMGLFTGNSTTTFSGVDIHITKFNASGIQDPTFGDNGRIYLSAIFPEYDIDHLMSYATIAVQPNGKFWVTGLLSLNEDPWGLKFLLRFNPDGQLDTTFATDGILNMSSNFNPYLYFDQVSLQRDGKLLFTGSACAVDGCRLNSQAAIIVQLNNDGSLDTSFGEGGVARFRPSYLERAIQDFYPSTKSITLLSDNKLIVVMRDRRSPGYLYLARLTTDGKLDSTFGGNGLIAMDISSTPDEILFETHVQANGKILVGASQNDQPLMARFNPDGTPDLTWGGSGYVTTPLPKLPDNTLQIVEFGNFALQRDGKIIAVPRMEQSGFALGSHHIVRFKGDPAFGYTGLTPAHLTTDISISADLTLTFGESVNINAGKIEIRRVADFSLFENIPVTDTTRISGGGTNSITINPGADFEPNTQYFVLVDPNTFTNAAGHPFSGVRELVEWHFTTGDAPPAPVNLISNAGFEGKATNNPKRAAKWTANKLVAGDGRMCNKSNKTPPVTYAYDGKCAFQFKLSTPKTRYIEQKITLTEVLAGQTMRVAGYIKRNKLTTGAAIQVQVTYVDNSKATFKITIPSGTQGYKPFENILVLEKDATKARVRITTGKSEGRLLVDGLSLTVSDEAALAIGELPISVPDAPDLRGN